MDEGVKSFWEWWREKTSSSLYFTFVFSFIAWNWRGLYILFADDPTSSLAERLLRFEYELHFGTHFPASALNYYYSLGLPAVSTFLIVLLFPKINEWAHKIETASYFKRKEEYLKMESESIQRVNYALNIQVGEIKKQETLVKEKSESKNRIETLLSELSGDGDYEEFKKTSLYYTFPKFVSSIYESVGTPYWSRFDSKDLSIADSFSLVKLDRASGEIELTQKGRDFNRRVSQKR